MSGYSPYFLPSTGHYGQGEMKVWWFRWHDCAKPGHYIGTFDYGDGTFDHRAGTENFNAVVDDFGNLRRVP